jgi:MFS transporter, ACS family, tartrate transporter
MHPLKVSIYDRTPCARYNGGNCERDRIFAKCAWRLLPLLVAAYIVNYVDRTNVGFATSTINRDLDFSRSVYGLSAGIFFISYAVF